MTKKVTTDKLRSQGHGEFSPDKRPSHKISQNFDIVRVQVGGYQVVSIVASQGGSHRLESSFRRSASPLDISQLAATPSR